MTECRTRAFPGATEEPRPLFGVANINLPSAVLIIFGTMLLAPGLMSSDDDGMVDRTDCMRMSPLVFAAEKATSTLGAETRDSVVLASGSMIGSSVMVAADSYVHKTY